MRYRCVIVATDVGRECVECVACLVVIKGMI